MVSFTTKRVLLRVTLLEDWSWETEEELDVFLLLMMMMYLCSPALASLMCLLFYY